VRWRTIALTFGGAAVLLSLGAEAAAPRGGGNCVAYARAVTGIELDGNAAAWWPHAAGRYERGQVPKLGAILVFKPSGYMHVGHVAVVSRIVGPREILVDQANWIPGRVVKAMSVIDASPANDWTSVKVIELHSGTHGRENPTYGFIYPSTVPTALAEAYPDSADPHHVQERVAQSRDKARHRRLQVADAKHDGRAPRPARERVAESRNKARHERTEIAEARHDGRDAHPVHDRVAQSHDKTRHEHVPRAAAKTDAPKPDDAALKRLAKHDPHRKAHTEDAKLAYLY